MNPIDWLKQSNQMRETYGRYPHADRTALNAFKQQAQGFMNDQEQQYQANPGRAIGGTGTTGLQSRDSGGYAHMLESQQAMAGLQNFMKGKSGPNVEVGQLRERHIPGGISPASGAFSPIPQAQAGPVEANQSHEAFMAQHDPRLNPRKPQV